MNACVILSFNQRERTTRCVQSALKFFNPNDIILVHNGSLPENANPLQRDFSNIKHLILDSNSGFTGGANQGLDFAFGLGYSQVLFLTNDTQLKEFTESVICEGILAPVVTKRGRDIIDSVGGTVNMVRGQIKHLKQLDPELQIDFVPGCAFIISVFAWRRLKGFDEKYFCYWEDVDLGFRARALNIPLAQTDEIVVNHDISKTNGKKPYYTFYLFQRNRYLFMKTFASKSSFLIFSIFWKIEQYYKHIKCRLKRDRFRLELSRKLLTEKC